MKLDGIQVSTSLVARVIYLRIVWPMMLFALSAPLRLARRTNSTDSKQNVPHSRATSILCIMLWRIFYHIHEHSEAINKESSRQCPGDAGPRSIGSDNLILRYYRRIMNEGKYSLHIRQV